MINMTVRETKNYRIVCLNDEADTQIVINKNVPTEWTRINNDQCEKDAIEIAAENEE